MCRLRRRGYATVSTRCTSAAQKHSQILTFQQAIQRLQEYWASVGCAVMQCSNTEVGAGTMNPLTFLRVLGPEPWNVAYVEPSIHPDDSRYGENPTGFSAIPSFSLARQCAQLWSKTRESLGHPLGVISEPVQLVCAKDLLVAMAKKVHNGPELFVLEVRTEELPPHDILEASQMLKDLVLRLLKKHRLNHGEVKVFGTPCRVVVCVDKLSSKQEDIELEFWGPPVQKAFDEQGKPTKDAEGFCRRYNVTLDQLYRKVEGE